MTITKATEVNNEMYRQLTVNIKLRLYMVVVYGLLQIMVRLGPQ